MGRQLALLVFRQLPAGLRDVKHVDGPVTFGGDQHEVDVAFVGKYAIQGNYNGPVIWDIGTSNVDHAKVSLCMRLGQPLREGLAFDEHGQPTTDPTAALSGAYTYEAATRARDWRSWSNSWG